MATCGQGGDDAGTVSTADARVQLRTASELSLAGTQLAAKIAK